MSINDENIEIKEFTKLYSTHFARLNYEWIKEYFEIEDHDREMLDDPQEYIINKGGQIFFAFQGDFVVGTVALIKEADNSFELAKMAVSPNYRGKKIGEKLMTACLEYSKEVGVKKVFLLSNTKLIPALSLYKKFGFIEVPLDPNNLYKRTDIQMEIIL